MAKHIAACTILVFGLLWSSVACGPGAADTPPPSSPRETAVRQLAPTSPIAALSPSAGVPSPTGTPEAGTLTPTAAPETPLPTSTLAPPTPVIPLGLYVTYLNTIPDPPQRGQELKFHVGIANNTSTVQPLRWVVYIYRPEDPGHSFGQTAITSTFAPVGATEFISDGFWKLSLGGPCEDFVARVAWLDQDNRAAQFKEPNGMLFEKPLTVCPP